MSAPEMNNQHHPTPAGGEEDLASQIDGMIDESADAEDTSAERDTGDADASAPQDTGAEQTDSGAPSSDELEQSVAGLDEMLAEAVANDDDPLAPIDDDPDDPDASIESDLDEALGESTNGSDAEQLALDPHDEPGDGQQAEEPAPAVADEGPADDPDETDIPEVFGPDTELFEPDDEDVPDGEAPRSPGEEPTEGAQSPPTQSGTTPSSGARPGVLAKARSVVVPALGPIGAASVRVADVISSPLARLSTDKRDLLGLFVLVTLFNALCLFVAIVVLG